MALVLDLGGHRRYTRAAHGCDLGGLRTDGDATAASVVGDAVVVVVDDYGAIVDVGDSSFVDAVDGAVVVEVVSVPIAAVIARACVAEAVVNAAVEADVRSPEATLKAVAVAEEGPVAGSPELSRIRGENPGSGDPVVADGGVAPVAGRPDVVGPGGFGLLVGGERGWSGVGFEGLLTGVYLVLVVLVVLPVLIGRRLGLLGVGGGFRLWVFFGLLLALVLLTHWQDASWGGSLHWGWLLLGSIGGSHVGVGGIGPGVVGCDVCVGCFVAACDGCDSGEGCDPDCEG